MSPERALSRAKRRLIGAPGRAGAPIRPAWTDQAPPGPPGPAWTLNELSRWTSTCVPSDFVTVTSYPFLVKSVVTAPAVPLPTLATAAACAFVALSPVTAVSASSCAAEPCAGIDDCDALDDVLPDAV